MHLAAARMCAIHGIRVVCRGRFPTGPAILVSNHLSYIDPVAILAHVPAGVVAKSEVGNWPLLGEVIRTMGVLMVDRGCTMSGAIVLRRALRILRAGGSVLAFPEGTTTLGDEVLPFRRGFFGLARIAGCPMVPVAVRYESTEPCWVGDAPFLPHYLRMSARPHTRGQVLVGEALDPRSADSADALAEEARLAVRDMLRSPW
ncbi:MAG: lysophospholipid acyltransferase family protein [Myxococcota bacterium]